jgi:hypothetical protein
LLDSVEETYLPVRLSLFCHASEGWHPEHNA